LSSIFYKTKDGALKVIEDAKIGVVKTVKSPIEIKKEVTKTGNEIKKFFHL